jgi:hydroxyacylglutathione hydrolase
MSYVLHEPSGDPWVVFTGDALFAGDVGRVDLLGMDRADDLAGMLYDSIFSKLLPLGDGVIVCPAHGAGSVCGSEIADRPWTTIGLERRLNPKLQHKNRDDFIPNVAKELERPPYFRQVERMNLEGPPILGTLPIPPPLSAREFAKRAEGAVVLDTRMELGFGAAHVPGALSIWLGGLAGFAGWFLPYDRPILVVNETNDSSETVQRLIRLGYDNLAGSLSGGMLAWHTAGLESGSIRTITVQELCRRLDEGERVHMLDVRSEHELEIGGRIPDAQHIHLTQLPGRLGDIPKDRAITVFCGSGMRSMIAASLLKREGFGDVRVALGGLSGWKSTKCPIETNR